MWGFSESQETVGVSPRMFEEISLPSLKVICETLVEAGITPVLHCDGNWDLNLETLRELPAGNVVVQFDGASDIFKAKEILGEGKTLAGLELKKGETEVRVSDITAHLEPDSVVLRDLK